MALQIVESLAYNSRSFGSTLVVGGTDYSSSFNSDGANYPVGYDFVDGLQGWEKSASNAISTEIQTNGSYTWLNFNQYGYQGGRLTRSYPEIIVEIGTTFFLPTYTVGGISGDVGLKFKTLAGDNAIKIAIDRNSIKVFEWDGVGYVSLLVVDTSAELAGSEIFLQYAGSTVSISSLTISPLVANLSYGHDIQIAEIFSENGSDYPLTLQLFYLDGFAGEQRNLNLVIPPQLASEYVAGDVLIVSSHEGSDYGGDSMLPRVSGQFTALSPAKDVSIGAVGFQRFWARTLTSNEPLLYQFTRGDSNSHYDSPKLIGFIVRGAVLEDLTVSFSDAVTGENALQLIASNSCNAAQGDLVYGYAHNESNYDEMYTVAPTMDFLWFQGFPYGVTSLREAGAGDDGIVRFQHISAAFDYKVFAARISSGILEPPPEPPPLGLYEQYQGDLPTTWLQATRGRAWNEGSGKTKDQFIDAVTDAVQARFVQSAPSDALGFLASDRLLERYPQETDAIFRARIAGVWNVWEFAGTKYGLEQVLLQAGWNCSIIEHWQSDPSIWAEFSVIVYAVSITPNPWGTGVWGIFAWGGNPQAIPTSSLRRLINKFKAGHSKIRELRITAPNAFIWGQSVWGGTNPYSNSTII